jgi:protein-tyrosine phosphatase
MDSWNVRNTMRIIGSDKDGKVTKLLGFAGEGGDIADPWYTGNFDETYDDVLRGCKGLLRELGY